MIKINLTERQTAVIESALAQRVEYFTDLLENYEGFGHDIQEMYENELTWAQETLNYFKEI